MSAGGSAMEEDGESNFYRYYPGVSSRMLRDRRDPGTFGEKPQDEALLEFVQTQEGGTYARINGWVPIYFPAETPSHFSVGEALKWETYWTGVRGYWVKVAQENSPGVNIWQGYDGISIGEVLWRVYVAQGGAPVWLDGHPLYNGVQYP